MRFTLFRLVEMTVCVEVKLSIASECSLVRIPTKAKKINGFDLINHSRICGQINNATDTRIKETIAVLIVIDSGVFHHNQGPISINLECSLVRTPTKAKKHQRR